MEIVVVLLAFVLLAVVVAVISAPLRARLDDAGDVDAHGHEVERASERAYAIERADLEAARETKYREIRDAELDFRTGKLSHEDYAALDATLRSEALEILDRLEALAAPRDTSSTEANPQLED